MALILILGAWQLLAVEIAMAGKVREEPITAVRKIQIAKAVVQITATLPRWPSKISYFVTFLGPHLSISYLKKSILEQSDKCRETNLTKLIRND